MSVFSDTLTRYIEHKNIKVFSLAKYCNLDRSTMYKILNGKRNPPSSEVFEKMTQFMHLTPIEYNFLNPFMQMAKLPCSFNRIINFFSVSSPVCMHLHR